MKDILTVTFKVDDGTAGWLQVELIDILIKAILLMTKKVEKKTAWGIEFHITQHL